MKAIISILPGAVIGSVLFFAGSSLFVVIAIAVVIIVIVYVCACVDEHEAEHSPWMWECVEVFACTWIGRVRPRGKAEYVCSRAFKSKRNATSYAKEMASAMNSVDYKYYAD